MISYKTDGVNHTFGFDPSDILQWLEHVQFQHGDKYIDYSPENVCETYRDSKLHLLQNHRKNVRAPYQIALDYRSGQYSSGWGQVAFEAEAYEFPNALDRHRSAMIKDFGGRGLLSKQNQPAPRMAKFTVDQNGPQFVLQKAHYYDQVGTNLSIDYPLNRPIDVDGRECRTVREWDVVQSHGTAKVLPSFEESRLANTIGVAIGVSARSKDGQVHWLRRKRSKSVAVYANMWHLPFSFALRLDEFQGTSDLRPLIRLDLGQELAEEFGSMELSDFGELKPVAFCRDLARGGKPQFFLELPCLVPYERLKTAAKERTETHEFTGKVEQVHEEEETRHYSSELACFCLLMEGRS